MIATAFKPNKREKLQDNIKSGGYKNAENIPYPLPPKHAKISHRSGVHFSRVGNVSEHFIDKSNCLATAF